MLTTMLQHGSDEPPPARRILRAGPLTVVYEAGDLRYIRLGEHEVLRRIYSAVRDQNWGTTPAALSDERVEAGADWFEIAYTSTYERGDIAFRQVCRMRGEPDGTIAVEIHGVALRPFLRNRIGLCVLHPSACAGAAVRVRHSGGAEERGSFPVAIAPHQPFIDITSIAHEVAPGRWAELALAGDTFEMEDQRNWTDASFKTYSTPLALPFPVAVAAGETVTQSVTLRLSGGATLPGIDDPAAPVRLRVADAGAHPLPPIGFGVASDGRPLSDAELARVRALRPAHLRVEIAPGEPGWRAKLDLACAEARALGAALELVLRLGETAAELSAIAGAIADRHLDAARCLVFPRGAYVSEGAPVRAARLALGGLLPGARFGGGTLAHFAELNRARPAADDMDTLAFSLTPQVHAFDLASLAENLQAQGDAVASAARLYPDLPVAVGPVTLRQRFNAVATGAEAPLAAGELPPQVDPRQLSLFGAGWTVGSIARLAGAGAASLTYYEVAGPCGLQARADAAASAAFPATPGAVYPLYHVFRAAAEYAGGELLSVELSDSLRVAALALRRSPRTRLLAANLSAERVMIAVDGLRGQARVRALDAAAAAALGEDPERFDRWPAEQPATQAATLTLSLEPFALCCVDVDQTAL